MFKSKVIWLILGVLVTAAGLFVLENSPFGGIGLLIVGLAMVIMTAIGMMHGIGRVNEEFFHHDNAAAQTFTPQDLHSQESKSVWDQMAEKQEDRK